MKSLNKTQLIGNVGQVSEMNEPGGKKVINLSLATNFLMKDEKGNNKTITDWHRLTAWGKTAELIAEHVKKGSYLFVEGYLKNNPYQDEKGNKFQNTTVIVEEFILLS